MIGKNYLNLRNTHQKKVFENSKLIDKAEFGNQIFQIFIYISIFFKNQNILVHKIYILVHFIHK